MSSITVTFTGNSSSLTSHFYPEIELDERFSYSCCLLDFCTYNSIPNVHSGNNTFLFSLDGNIEANYRKIIIPPGSYELKDIGEYLEKAVAKAYFDQDAKTFAEQESKANAEQEPMGSEEVVEVEIVKLPDVGATDLSSTTSSKNPASGTNRIKSFIGNLTRKNDSIKPTTQEEEIDLVNRAKEIERWKREEEKRRKREQEKKREEGMKKTVEELKKREFQVIFNKNNMTTTIKTGNGNLYIGFGERDSIGQVLGFSRRPLHSKNTYASDTIVNIQNINTIRVDCDITSGSYNNGERTHTIYEFIPTVDPGYKIIEQPQNLIYLPVNRHRMSGINITVLDQYGNLVDFRGELITCRIHIKRDH